MRKLVHGKIKDAKAEELSQAEMQAKAKELNLAKNELLEVIKSGFTKIPKEVVSEVEGRKDGAIVNLAQVVKDLFELKLSEVSK